MHYVTLAFPLAVIYIYIYIWGGGGGGEGAGICNGVDLISMFFHWSKG